MSGSDSHPQLSGLSGVLSATSVFSGYRIAAIVTYVISDLALVGAVVAYVFVDLETALAIGGVAVLLTLVALRCGQIVFSSRYYEDRIPDDETVSYEFGARQAAPLSLLRSPMLVLVTDRAVHAFVVGVIARDAVATAEHEAGATLRQSPTARSGDVELQIGTHTIGLRGLSADELAQANALLG